MRILVVSQYFWPESFIINDLTRVLSNQGHVLLLPQVSQIILTVKSSMDTAPLVYRKKYLVEILKSCGFRCVRVVKVVH